MRKLLCCGFAFAIMSAWMLRAAGDSNAEVERGRYLVTEVAKCADCHSSRGENGQFDKTQWLKGTMLNFKPTDNVPHWKAMSPDITPGGRLWKRRGEEALQKFLETAVWPDGDRADPPMPDYHLQPEDAKAIIAYLKTLQ